MKAFRIEGKMELSKRTWQRFSKDAAAENEDKATEKIFCELGSKHGLSRKNIRIRSIREISRDEITDAVVLHQMGDD